MLIIDSEAARTRLLSETLCNEVWSRFLGKGTSNHSVDATTLPSVMNRCEKQNIPYQLMAMPGAGYFIRRLDLGEAIKLISEATQDSAAASEKAALNITK